ncbi:MAG TPA: HAMP domain-containing sensor histidine kinase [Beijerinckiaceae bacterium]|nr:HAMP domain-containing sensor histidine kinase [Beijerinckiaceae bacterium]
MSRSSIEASPGSEPVGITPAAGSGRAALAQNFLRRIPIRWRILLIAIANTAVVLILAVLIAQSARIVNNTWTDLVRVRASERIVSQIDSEAGRVQSLIHRYFTQPSPELLAEVESRWNALQSNLIPRAAEDPVLQLATRSLSDLTNRLVGGFDALRAVREKIAEIYEGEVLTPAKEMTGLYAIIESTVEGRNALISPALRKSRESFSTALVAINAYYLSLSATSAREAVSNLQSIENTLPVMLDLADSEIQTAALKGLQTRAAQLRKGIDNLAAVFDRQSALLRDEVDKSQAEMSAATATLSADMQARENAAQERLDQNLKTIYILIAGVTAVFLVFIIIFGVLIVRSIITPLQDLAASMEAIVAGDLKSRVRGLDAKDEIGVMARAIEVFRENAIAKVEAEEELRRSKQRTENAYMELRKTQDSLIEAEKLAALGGLVAGVAHEVNNPVGISLTVASSLARRCELFSDELARGELKRSQLTEFIQRNREAATQLVANLQRAGELIQSFKQVAVDRSHIERRVFDLKELTEQVIASLRPGLSKSRVTLTFTCEPGITMDSYPGPYGQVVTNIVLNAVAHAFPPGQSGTMEVHAALENADQVAITFSDNGRGMAPDVRRRAFEPFFTTRRSQGGTGLGLHIVHNIITGRLGGRISISSEPERGTTFRVVIPRAAPHEAASQAVIGT